MPVLLHSCVGPWDVNYPFGYPVFNPILCAACWPVSSLKYRIYVAMLLQCKCKFKLSKPYFT